MKYSKEQQEAINTIDGQVCIISVAGSGKTSVIVARANNIIKSGVRPYRILVLTFSKAAAVQMADKYKMQYGSDGIRFSTIHSLCYSVLARAYNLTVQASGRTLSGGLDPAALHMPKRFFGAARNMREGGSLTILATALVETGSKMDDVVFEEFKGTGNMELVLDRKLSEKRVFPAIDIAKSSTRREDLLLNSEEQEAVDIMRKALNGLKTDEAAERILDLFVKTKNNQELVRTVVKNHYI